MKKQEIWDDTLKTLKSKGFNDEQCEEIKKAIDSSEDDKQVKQKPADETPKKNTDKSIWVLPRGDVG